MAKNTKMARASVKAGLFEPGSVTNKELIGSAECIKLTTNMESNTTKTLRHGTEMCDEAFKVFDAAFCRMSKREMEVEEATRKHVSVLRDKAGQVADALARIEKLGGVDFETKLQRLERFAVAVETLERLNKNGRLVDMVKAMAAIGA